RTLRAPQRQARVDGQVRNYVYSSFLSSLNLMRFTKNKIVHHHHVIFLGIIRTRRDVAARDSYSRDTGVRKHHAEERKSAIARRRRYVTAEQQLSISAVVLDQRAGVSITAFLRRTASVRLIHIAENRGETVDR